MLQHLRIEPLHKKCSIIKVFFFFLILSDWTSSVSTEEHGWSDSQRLHEALYKRGCFGRRGETGEKPHTSHHSRRSFVKVIYGLFGSGSRISLPSLCFSPRPATDAKPEGNAPKDSASRSSLRSSCFVSFAHVSIHHLVCFMHITHGCILMISINNRNRKQT